MRLRGDGTIFQNPNSPYWHMRIWHNGKPITRSTGEVDEKKAQRQLRDFRNEVKNGSFVAQGDKMTLKDLIELVKLDYAKKRNRSIANVGYAEKHLFRHLGETTRVKTITAQDADRYMIARREEGAADATVYQEVSALKRGFRLAVEKGLLSPQARPLIQNVKVGNANARQGFVVREEMERAAEELRKLDRDDYADLIEFLFHCPWRSGEPKSLTWDSYDQTAHGFHLAHEHDKAKRGRFIPIAGELVAIMDRRLARRRLDCPFVFHRDGKPIGDIRKTLKRAFERAGLAGRLLHDLRRSGAGHLRRAGVAPQTIMAIGGWSTMSTFLRYNIVAADELGAALEMGAAATGDKSRVAVLGRSGAQKNRLRSVSAKA